MKSSLAVCVCLLSAVVACAQPVVPPAEPLPTMPKRVVVQDGAVEQLPSMPKRDIIQESAVPCHGCANQHDGMPYFERRWPPLYQGGPPVREPNAFHDTGRLTWWFIPTPRALIQAICP